MIIRFVKLSFSPQNIAKFKEFEQSIAAKIVDFEGCTFLEILQDINNPEIFFTHSHWKSAQDLDNYKNSEFFKQTWNTTKQWFNGKPEAWSLRDCSEIT
ncbi:MAG: antibiotic biosynthesis monooxygenase [Bacteroidales bacterium]|nr:antibiotic biosynthesis monooxygenase [Bacteroidales bacterium]